MLLNKISKIIKPLETSTGFTLIEAMLSVALLGLVAVGISAPYISGFQALDVQADRMLLDSALRSRMEVLVATDFGSLGNDQEDVTVNGKNFKIKWKIDDIDLDGDDDKELNVVEVEVYVNELPERSLTTILVDNQGKTGKIS